MSQKASEAYGTVAGALDRIPDYLWLDGEIVPWDSAMVHVTEIGWAAVSSVYEGVKAYWNTEEEQLYGFLFERHARRLLQSMKIVRMNSRWSVEVLIEAMQEVLRANDARQDTYILPFAYWGGGGLNRAYSIAEYDRPTSLLIAAWPFTSHLRTGKAISACVSSWTRLSDNSMPPRAKCTSNYQNSRLASTEARLDGYDSAIILNDRGKVTKGPGACLYVIRDGVAIAPSVTSGILESITRSALAHLFREEMGVRVVEREVDRTELYVADEVFFCGTGAEITPVTSIDHMPVGDGQVGPISANIDGLYHDLVRGIDKRYTEWRTPIWPRPS